MLSSQALSRDAAAPARRLALSVVTPWAALALLCFTSACAPSAKLAQPEAGAADFGPYEVYTSTPAAPSASPAASHLEARIRTEVEKWRGTPHVLGGEDRNGVDCSAFVRNVFDSAFDVPLPRTTKDQVEAGHPVSANALQPGDLVFFKPSGKTRHVGIYLNKGEFAHASESQGVTISQLADRYWRDAYWTSRRILADSPPPIAQADQTRARAVVPVVPAATTAEAPPPPVQPAQPAQPDGPRRIGW